MKPILFNTEMVQAILDGRKTVTRRVIKPQPLFYTGRKYIMPDDCPKKWQDADDIFQECAYCEVGDILYVRETWKKYTKRVGIGDNCQLEDFIAYKADENRCDYPSEYFEEKWRPSIHMPKEAARIFLKVTDVRVERLQDITEEQTRKEGIVAWTKDGRLYKYAPADNEGDGPNCKCTDCPREYKEAMKKLWNSTIKKKEIDEYGWDVNPWVWVYEFERCEKEVEG